MKAIIRILIKVFLPGWHLARNPRKRENPVLAGKKVEVKDASS